MVILLPVLLTLATAAAVAGMRIQKRLRVYAWLAGVTGAALAWLSVLLARMSLPARLQLAYWEPTTLFAASPALLLDEVSWSLTLALATICLSALLTMVASYEPTDRSQPGLEDVITILFVTALAQAALLSANLFTTLILWAAIDLVELMIWLGRSNIPVSGVTSELLDSAMPDTVRQDRALSDRQSVLQYSARSAGLMALLSGTVFAHASGLSVAVTLVGQSLAPFMLVAVGIRLGVLPASALPERHIHIQRSVRAVMLLAPAAASLIIAIRAASAGTPASLTPAFLVLAGLAAIFGSLSWSRGQENPGNNPSNQTGGGAQFYWITALSAFVIASAARAQLSAALAWSLALLLPGGMLSLLLIRSRWLRPLIILGALGISALPFTPAWAGIWLFSAPFSWSLLLFLLGLSLLLAEYFRQGFRQGTESKISERWVWAIYPWGLTLLILIQWAIAWWTRPSINSIPGELPSLRQSWPAFVTAMMAALFLMLRNRRLSERPIAWLRSLLSFSWLEVSLWRLYYAMREVFRLVNRLLEGPGGVLWAFLLLALVVTIAIQMGAGG